MIHHTKTRIWLTSYHFRYYRKEIKEKDSSCRADEGVVLRPLTCGDCGFESRPGRRELSLEKVVCCQVEISTTDRSLVQRSPTEFGVSECDLEISTMRRPRPKRAINPLKKV
jgi:hypothetical protein